MRAQSACVGPELISQECGPATSQRRRAKTEQLTNSLCLDTEQQNLHFSFSHLFSWSLSDQIHRNCNLGSKTLLFDVRLHVPMKSLVPDKTELRCGKSIEECGDVTVDGFKRPADRRLAQRTREMRRPSVDTCALKELGNSAA